MKIYTDGSSKGNPGPGGFGVVVVSDDNQLLYCHSKMSEGDTTNNEQELLAIVFAAARYGRSSESTPQVFSDSAYAVNVFTEWMYTWRTNNWLKADNKVPENLEIIKFYYNLVLQGFYIDLHKIKGHSNNKWNNLADKLAKGELTAEEAVSLYEGGKNGSRKKSSKF